MSLIRPRAPHALLVLATVLAGADRPSSQAPAPARAPDGWSQTATFYRDQVQRAGIVGSSLVLVRDGQIAAEEYVGLQQLEPERSVDRDTIYHWASITKTFTGIAIMQLRDRGLLRLDDPVLTYVPEIRHLHNPFGDPSQITILSAR